MWELKVMEGTFRVPHVLFGVLVMQLYTLTLNLQNYNAAVDGAYFYGNSVPTEGMVSGT